MIFDNEGWELGNFGLWVRTGSTAIPSVAIDNPRNGIYNLHFNTSSSSTRWGKVIYSVPSAQLPAIRGITVIFKVYRWCLLIFAGGTGSFQRMELADGYTNPQTSLPFTPYSTYAQYTVSINVHASAPKLEFIIYWYKSGGGRIYHLDIDDMESDPISVLTPRSFATLIS